VLEPAPMGYSDFLEEVRNKQIKSAVIQEGPGRHRDRRRAPPTTAGSERRQRSLTGDLVGDLINNGVKFDVKPREEASCS